MKTTNYFISTISSRPRGFVLAALTLAISASLGAGSAQAALIARINGAYPVGGVASQTVSSYQTYTFQSTATSSTTLLSILFRNDPGFTYMDNVAAVLTGTSGNLLANSGTSGNLLANGGFDTNVGGGIIPDNWLSVGTQGLTAAGRWVAGGGNGFWFDGATGGFDGIAQYVATTPGQTYTISFDLQSTDTFNATSVVTEVYFGELPPGVVVTGGGSGAQIPEPTSILVMGLTTGGLLLRRRRLSSVAGSGTVA